MPVRVQPVMPSPDAPSRTTIPPSATVPSAPTVNPSARQRSGGSPISRPASCGAGH